MKKKLPFSIIFKDTNIDFNFDLHDQTVDSNNVGKIASILINEIDKELKKTQILQKEILFKHLLYL